MKHTQSNEYSIEYAVYFLLIISGITLAVIQFFFNRSLWYDESLLAYNIVSRTYSQLLQPLDLNQMAPIGFLYLEKTVALFFGNTDYSLRLLPLLCFVASVPLVYMITTRFTGSQLIGIVGSLYFSLNSSMVYYASEAKQYSTEVFFTLLIIYYTFKGMPASTKNIYRMAVLGIIAPWFSTSSVLVLFVCGLYLLWVAFRKEQMSKVILMILAWVFSFVVYQYFFVYQNPVVSYMLGYWQEYYIAYPLLSKAFFHSLERSMNELFSLFVVIKPKYWIIPFTLTITGVLKLFYDRDFKVLSLVLVPLLIHFFLSVLHIYPVVYRFILYYVPLLLIPISIGTVFIAGLLKRQIGKPASYIFMLVLILGILFQFKRFPFERQEIKQTLSYLGTHSQPDETIYVYYGSSAAVKFYTPDYPFLHSVHVVFGTKNREDWSTYSKEVRKIEGNVWLLFSHIWKFDPRDNECTTTLELLQKNGYSITDSFTVKGSAVYHLEKND